MILSIFKDLNWWFSVLFLNHSLKIYFNEQKDCIYLWDRNIFKRFEDPLDILNKEDFLDVYIDASSKGRGVRFFSHASRRIIKVVM